jgi:hypothetical protein
MKAEPPMVWTQLKAFAAFSKSLPAPHFAYANTEHMNGWAESFRLWCPHLHTSVVRTQLTTRALLLCSVNKIQRILQGNEHVNWARYATSSRLNAQNNTERWYFCWTAHKSRQKKVVWWNYIVKRLVLTTAVYSTELDYYGASIGAEV